MPQIPLSDYAVCLVAVRGMRSVGFVDTVLPDDRQCRVTFLPSADYDYYDASDITILVHCRDMIALANAVREANHG